MAQRILLSALWLTGLLLLVENGVEHGLLDVRLERAAGGVDEGVRTTLADLRELLLQVVLGGVIAELHVARQRAHQFERAVELVNNRRRQHRRRAQAAVDHYVVGFSALL